MAGNPEIWGACSHRSLSLSHLWVDAQGPAPALVNHDAVLGGELVLGQAPDIPLTDLRRGRGQGPSDNLQDPLTA